jgi:PAS domain S-box-containing protein
MNEQETWPEQSRQAIAAQEARFRHIIEENADGILILDEEGKVRYVNPAAEGLLGRPAAELLDDVLGFPLVGDATTELDILRTTGERVVAEMRVVRTEWEGRPALLASLRDVSERRQMEEALRASRLRYKTLFESASDAIFIHDLEGHFLEVNSVACARLGYSREELLGMTPADIDAPEFATLVPERIAELLAAGQLVIETIHETREGHRIPIELSTRVIDYEGQQAILSIARDVTERKQAEEHLTWQARTEAALAELSQALISTTSLEEIADLVLERAKELTGSRYGYVGHIDPGTGHLISTTMTRDVWEECEVAGKSVVFHEFSGLWGWVLDHREALLVNEPAQDPRSSGTPGGHIPVERFLSAPAMLGEELVGQIALVNPPREYTARDLHLVERMASLYALAVQRQRADEELRRSQTRFANLLGSISDGFFALDEKLVVTYFNAAAERILGREREEVLGRPLFEAFPEARGSIFEEQYRRALREQEPLSFETPFDPEPYANWYAVQVYPFERGISVHFQVITERKEAERALLESQKRLKALFDNALDAIFLADDERRYVEVNPAASALLGYSEEELLAMRVDDISEQSEGTAEAWQAFLKQGEMQGEYRTVRRDGTQVDVEFNAVAHVLPGLNLSILRDVSDRKRSEARIQHLNAVLRAIRNVNQVISQETDRERLIEQACTFLVETRGYHSAWIVTFDGNGSATGFAESGLEESFWPLKEQIKGGELPRCAQEALETPGVYVMDDPECACVDCPLRGTYSEEGAMAARLEHDKRVYGLLTVAIPAKFTYDEEEQVLVEELAEDIALALHSLEVEAQRARAEQALKESEQRFRAMLSNVQLIGLMLDTEGHITFINDFLLELTGWEREEVLGRDWFDRFLPEPLGDDLKERYHEMIPTESLPQHHENDIVTRTGERRTIRWNNTILRTPAGEVSGWASIGEDVTERKRAEEALRESERKLEMMLETMVDGMVVVDPEGRITYANPAAIRILELKYEEALERYYDEEGWQQIDAAGEPFPRDRLPLAIALRDLHPVAGVEHGIISPTGERKWLSVNAAPLFDEQGELYGAVASFRDVTERQRAEQALQEQEARLRLLFEETATPILVTNTREEYVDANAAALQFLECSLEELRQRTVWDFTVPGTETQVREEHSPFVARRSLEVDYLVNGRVKTLLLNVVPVSSAGQTLLYGIGLDITERQQAQEQLERFAQELQRSNQELEQFAYVASHDLREPLRMIRSYVELLARRYEGQLDADADDFIGFTVEGVARMQALIDGLLSYSRIGTRGRPFVPTATADVLAQTLRNLEVAIAEEEAQIHYGELPPVRGDSIQLVQLFQNLIDNALKFSNARAPEVEIRATREGQMWRFAVQDNGIGIAPRHRERIFQIFQRLHTREEYPGTGIGLAMCKKIVERHGGRIWVETEAETGSTFYFTLPAVAES